MLLPLQIYCFHIEKNSIFTAMEGISKRTIWNGQVCDRLKR